MMTRSERRVAADETERLSSASAAPEALEVAPARDAWSVLAHAEIAIIESRLPAWWSGAHAIFAWHSGIASSDNRLIQALGGGGGSSAGGAGGPDGSSTNAASTPAAPSFFAFPIIPAEPPSVG